MSQPPSPFQQGPQSGGPPQNPYGQNPYGQAPGAYPSPPPSGDNQLGTIAFVCALLSLVMGCPLSIAATIMGWIAMKKEPKGLATAGFVIGLITLVVQVIVGCIVGAVYIAAIAAVAGIASTMGPYMATEVKLREAADKIEAHYDENEEYPTDEEGRALIVGIKDHWERQIEYRRDENDEYVLTSAGEDGVMGNGDDQTFVAAEYDYDYSDDSWEDIKDPTGRVLVQASDKVWDYYMDSPSDDYPTDADGQKVIDGMKDQWGNQLVYRRIGTDDNYLVISPGPDGLLDTDDDLTDEDF